MEKTIICIKDTNICDKDRTNDYFAAFLKALGDRSIDDTTVQVVRLADIGFYNKGVVVQLYPSKITYGNISLEDIARIIDETIVNNKIINSLVIKKKADQIRIVLRNCGVIDPENINDYIENGGYSTLKDVLANRNPSYVIDQLKISGLRGRGGGGFPTWMKWSFAQKTENDTKYMICNADEGDPGAYMDRSILEGDPHSVIEGMILGGFTIGAQKGFFYIRAEYPLAIERVEKAIAQARANGFLGKNILNSKFSFDLEIRLGAGAFVCGEETALIASIEGKRGYPSPRPPYPSVKGLWGKPTVINNVETLANIPVIFEKGAEWYASIGTDESKGTKVFALTGKVNNSGLIEVPMGTTLHDIVYEIGGGIANGRTIKAVQTGGPSGGVIPVEHIHTPVGYGSLQKLGSIMGSGGMIVMDDTDCMVDISKFYLGFCVDESCGKCAPCRIGGYQMLNVLTKISHGNGTEQDIRNLKKIAHAMQKASLCGLGQTAPNPVISTLKFFLSEYMEHITDKKCKAGKCSKLFTFRIIENKCKRCSLCVRHCPANAISGNREQGFTIDTAKCVKCGQCYDVCKFNAISRG
jgi:NADH:ubiquinone oxidoreductase subunit F (NADH-binding)